MNELIIETSEDSFDKDVLQSPIPVLVDFWAAWCGPCRAIAPHLDNLASQYQGVVQIAKVDVDQNRNLAKKMQITSIPRLMVFKNGQVVADQTGALPKDKIEALIQKALP